ncbi:hypothetical protein LTR62_002243 [Meristemomyces frigidus]|uniref:Exosome complex protein n=1 Tax=Meristemomyces frigidus TaxID=1508187 RepID=A0AAN7TJQ0_9PEZI|nr:hypothetical protein LTR62_002243 [Meristemomyces frigidus]
MDTADVESLVEDLSIHIDDLEDSLMPLLKTALSASTSKLPLLDKAKLYVLATYAIESIIFSALRLNGVDAKAHPVFQELNRVKEYFGKIKTAETAGQKRSTVVDKDAAGRFIKHGLAGNERFDRERSSRQANEKNGAKRKLEDMGVGTHTRFSGMARRVKAGEGAVSVVRAAGLDEDDQQRPGLQFIDAASSTSEAEKAAMREAKRQRRQERKEAKANEEDYSAVAPAGRGASSAADSGLATGPKPHGEVLQALQQGPTPEDEGRKAKKKKRKSRGDMAKDMEARRADERK